MNVKLECAIRRGDIFIAKFGSDDDTKTQGSEQKGTRPVVVIQNNQGNKCSPTTIIAYLTSQPRTDSPYHVKLADDCGLDFKESIVLLEQIKTVDISRFIVRIGTVSDNDMKRIDLALKVSLGLE